MCIINILFFDHFLIAVTETVINLINIRECRSTEL